MRDRATANDVPFAPLDKLFEPTVPKGPELPQVDTLDIAQLHPFADHPFHLYTDEKLRDLTDSIREHGVLMPVLVRPMASGGYEIISGHNRVEAAKLAGLDKVPVTIRPRHHCHGGLQPQTEGYPAAQRKGMGVSDEDGSYETTKWASQK